MAKLFDWTEYDKVAAEISALQTRAQELRPKMRRFRAAAGHFPTKGVKSQYLETDGRTVRYVAALPNGRTRTFGPWEVPNLKKLTEADIRRHVKTGEWVEEPFP